MARTVIMERQKDLVKTWVNHMSQVMPCRSQGLPVKSSSLEYRQTCISNLLIDHIISSTQSRVKGGKEAIISCLGKQPLQFH